MGRMAPRRAGRTRGPTWKIFRIGKLPFNENVSACYNAVRPDIGPEWTLRVQIALLLPTSIFWDRSAHRVSLRQAIKDHEQGPSDCPSDGCPPSPNQRSRD